MKGISAELNEVSPSYGERRKGLGGVSLTFQILPHLLGSEAIPLEFLDLTINDGAAAVDAAGAVVAAAVVVRQRGKQGCRIAS